MLRKLSMLVALIVATSLTALAQCPDNEIWYTTRDGKKAELYVGHFLDWSNPDLKIMSHTYSNGKGVIRANGPIKHYGYYEPAGEGIMLSLNVDTITFPDSLEGLIATNFDGIKTFKGKYASADGRCLIINGELLGFAPEGLTSYTVPNGVTKIGDYAFFLCENLTSITLPQSVTKIGDGAFLGCTNLRSINIPSGVTEIGLRAFEDCNVSNEIKALAEKLLPKDRKYDYEWDV